MAILKKNVSSVTASATESGVVTSLIDGATASGGGYWNDSTPPTYVVFDLGAEYKIANVKVYTLGYAKPIKLAVANNGNYDNSNIYITGELLLNINSTNSFAIPSIKGRYVKLITTQQDVHLSEVEIYIDDSKTLSLIKSGNYIYKFSGTEWIDTGLVESLTKSNFEMHGMEDLTVIPQAKLNAIGDFEVITWTNTTETPKLEISVSGYKPIEKLGRSLKILTWTNSDQNFTVNMNVNLDQKQKFLVSNDSKNSWYSFINNTWIQVPLTNISTQGMTKDELQNITQAQWKNWFVRGSLDFAVYLQSTVLTENTVPTIKSITVNFPSNQAPLIINPIAAPDTVHNEYVTLQATLTDQEGDDVHFQVWINNTQVYPETSGEWSPPQSSGTSILKAYNFPYFKVGSNTIMLKAKDTRDQISTWSQNVVITNTVPALTLTHGHFSLTGVIGDADGDKVGYRILINNKQIYPEQAGTYTPLANSPQEIYQYWTSDDLKYGELNNIKVEIIDSFGGTNSTTFQVMGTYQGLMFKDEYGNYFSTDKGNIMQYLDFGTITAGFESDAKSVNLVNQNDYAVDNIRLLLNKNNLVPHTDVKISKDSGGYFDWRDNVVYNATLQSGESIPFYVKLVTDMYASGGINFGINAKADIAE